MIFFIKLKLYLHSLFLIARATIGNRAIEVAIAKLLMELKNSICIIKYEIEPLIKNDANQVSINAEICMLKNLKLQKKVL